MPLTQPALAPVRSSWMQPEDDFSHKALSTVGRIQPDPSRGVALSVILPCLITILVQVHLAVIILINIVQVIFFFVMHL